MTTHRPTFKTPADRPHKPRIVGLNLPRAFDDLRTQNDPLADLIGCALIKAARQ